MQSNSSIFPQYLYINAQNQRLVSTKFDLTVTSAQTETSACFYNTLCHP